MTWATVSTDFDSPGSSNGGCWSPDTAEFVGLGVDGGETEAILKSADALAWIYQASPFDGGSALAVVRDTFNGSSVCLGLSSDKATAVATSPDNSAWTGQGNPFVVGGSALAVALYGTDLWIAGGDLSAVNHLSQTTDDGASWTQYQPFTNHSSDIAIRDSDGLILMVGDDNAVAISTDGGSTWTYSTPLTDHYSSPYAFTNYCTIRQGDGALIVTGYYTSQAHVLVSTDDGATWNIYKPWNAISSFDSAAKVIVRESDGAIITAGFTATGGSKAVVAVSTNDGVSWVTHRPYGTTGSRVNDLTIRPSDNAIVTVGWKFPASVSTPVLSVSTDSGATWTDTTMASEASRVTMRASDDLILVLDYRAGVSTDAGAHFTYTDPGFSPAGCITRGSDDALIVVGGTGGAQQAAISTDDGATWPDAGIAFSSATGSGYRLACKQSSGLVIAGGSGALSVLQATTDGGATFSPVASPLDSGGTLYGIDYSDGDDAWMISGVDGDNNVVAAISTDDGASWTVLTHPMVTYYTGIYPSVYRDEANTRWWLIGNTVSGNAIAYSDDAGATWTEVSSQLDVDLDTFSGGAYAMKNCGGILSLGGIDSAGVNQMCLSRDNGLTWVPDATPSPFGISGVAYGLAYSPDIPRAVVFGQGS